METKMNPVAAPALEDDLRLLERDGYVILPDLFDHERVRAMRDDLLPRFRRGGRNSFEGFATQRVYALLAKTRTVDALVDHPRVLALLDRILQPGYLLSALQAIQILPGEKAQLLHHDDALYPVPRPRPPLGAATILALDPFTADNGATVVLPGSHVWGRREPTPADVPRPIVMSAGSVVFFVGTLWHGGGANRSHHGRLAVTAQYCAPWCRQQENLLLAVPAARARSASREIQRMLGYSVFPPFVGHVDGMHPRRLLDMGPGTDVERDG